MPSIKNQEYFKKYLTKDLDTDGAIGVIKWVPEIIDIEDYNFLVNNIIKKFKKDSTSLQTMYPFSNYGFKLIILCKSDEDVLDHYVKLSKIHDDDLMFYLFMKGYSWEDMINKDFNLNYEYLLKDSREYHAAFMMNMPSYINTLSKAMIEYYLKQVEFLFEQRHMSWDLIPGFENPLRNLSHFNEYNHDVQKIIKKRIMELRLGKNEETENKYENISNMHSMFSGCKSINSRNLINSFKLSNLSITDEEDDE